MPGAEPATVVRHEVARPPVESGPSHAKVPDPARLEFLLLPADVTADRETPALAVDSEGRVLMAWASQTGELVRTLYLARSTDGGAHFDAPVPCARCRSTDTPRRGGLGGEAATLLDPRPAPAGVGGCRDQPGLGRGDRRRAQSDLLRGPIERRRPELLQSDARAWKGRREARLHDARGRCRWQGRCRLARRP